VNYVGFLNPAYRPSFSTSVVGNNKTLDIPGGTSKTMNVLVQGQSKDPLTVSFSDSETNSAQPDRIHFAANVTQIQSLQGSSVLQVTLTPARNLSPGLYAALVTVSDGIESSSAYVSVQVTQSKQ
jgi:hypothetical protein